jgi:hypothetical protein
METMDKEWTQRARIETSLSAFGAAFFGLGIGLLIGIRQLWLGAALAAVGLLAHGAGMVYLHRRLAGKAGERVAWLEWAYWLCWIILLVAILLVGWKYLRPVSQT